MSHQCSILPHLPSDKAQQLVDDGFAIIDGPYSQAELGHLSRDFDIAMASADPADVRISSSTRAWDIVSRTPEFERIYTYPPLLEACGIIVGEGFKLSATCFRSVNPGAGSQALHVDVSFRGDDWPILGFILMVDGFTAENGATRFVRGSQKRCRDPGAPASDANGHRDVETLACGSAGEMIIFDGSTWHGHSGNVTQQQRRSIQGHFVPRGGRGAIDYGSRLSPEVFARIGAVGRRVLGLTSVE
jgi:hypothetical protein